jgi:hypothetical protein
MNKKTHHQPHAHHVKMAAMVLLLVLFPSTAFAYTLQCSVGVPSGGDVFLGVGNCNAFGLTNIFSGLNCNFQQILNEIVKRMYCGIQYRLADTLNAVILIYIMVYAIMFTLGLSALTAKEITTRMIKIALIWAFAMNASWGVGIAFYGLVGGIETAIGWVLNTLTGGTMTGHGFFLYLDQLIFTQLTGGLTAEGYALLGFFATLFVLMPPVFFLFATYMITVLTALTRALISYLLGLSAIAFLISLGPIFISFAMFKSTYTFFDSWLKYLVSFALQIVMIFAATGLWLKVMSLFGNFFMDLASRIVPYERIHSQGSFAFFKNTWGFCPSGRAGNGLNCISGMPWPPSAYANDAGFIFYLTFNLISLGVVVYAFDALLQAIPDIARQLSGPKYAPQLGGGHGYGAVHLPGISGMDKLKASMLGKAQKGALGLFDKGSKSMKDSLTQEGARAQSFYNAMTSRQQGARRNAAQLVGNRGRNNAPSH